ncbi:L-2-hydroxyglutarate oxidase LhgO [Roseibium hamelinense]|uniref:L-2-hydroxyglutarate oxidase LhgO n=1 Tax=Roseibium hamelinense TaxID=150831 RepID=A0A562SF57_9HYPH|nr:NAD(P)/FAD-dependent oxidoreductase [Roseibium hamelinense]MTI44236.1 NAD(P)/FAD-dependent oxidoreductase [Roseibium hamelinense]TWI79979.1 L-2-hydroxyglutarate oxidase LhgO [Roseibium hamelinense]
MHDIETIVIGAGAVGLAIGRSLALSGRQVMVLEQHDIIGSETSARNSEVIHAGIYYPTGSLKARLCVEGKRLLYPYLRTNGVGHENITKLIVAAHEDQLADLTRIKRQAEINGVDDLKLLSREDALALEPELNAAGALLSPSTGILDSHGFMLALQGELEAHGGQVVLNTRIKEVGLLAADGFKVTVSDAGQEDYAISCRELVISAGHGATGLAAQIPGTDPPRAYLAKGNYFKLTGKSPFSRLIYPVPEPGGLGVHLTLDLQHQARFGPDVEWIEAPDFEVNAGRGDRFYAAIRSYWPGLEDGTLEPDYAGIRPKITGPGEPAADFRIDGPQAHGVGGLVALFGIESPGLTASLAIGDHVEKLL